MRSSNETPILDKNILVYSFVLLFKNSDGVLDFILIGKNEMGSF